MYRLISYDDKYSIRIRDISEIKITSTRVKDSYTRVHILCINNTPYIASEDVTTDTLRALHMDILHLIAGIDNGDINKSDGILYKIILNDDIDKPTAVITPVN